MFQNDHTKCEALKEKNFECSFLSRVKILLQQIQQCVNANTLEGKHAQNDLKKLNEYHRFLSSRCKERNYIFQVILSFYIDRWVISCLSPVFSMFILLYLQNA